MNNFLTISLSKVSKRLLKRLVKRLFPQYACIYIRTNTIRLKRNWFSKTKVVDIQDFVTSILPKALFDYAQSKEIDLPIESFTNSAEFIIHLSDTNETDIISYLWKMYSYIVNYPLQDECVTEIKSNFIIDIITVEPLIKKVQKTLSKIMFIIEKYEIKVIQKQYTPVFILDGSIRGSPQIDFRPIEFRNTG